MTDIDVSLTIAPNSMELTADDLLGGPRVVLITSVSLGKDKGRPIEIWFEGDDGKPYRPCLSMRRVMVKVWGEKGNDYVGKKLRLFRDETVKYAGLEVGGIRISHMSHITRPVTLALTETREKKKPYTVQPLIEAHPAGPEKLAPRGRKVSEWLAAFESNLEATHTLDEVNAVLDDQEVIRMGQYLQNGAKQRFEEARNKALSRFMVEEPPPTDPFEEAVEIAS